MKRAKKFLAIIFMCMLPFMLSCGGGGGNNSGPTVDSSKIVGTWRVVWAESSCVAGGTTITVGGTTEDYIVTAIDKTTISFGWSGSQQRYNLPLTLAQDGGMEALWETTSPDPILICTIDSKVPEMKYKDTIHSNIDNSTGYINEEWSFGENTACGSCNASSQSMMSKVSSSTSAQSFSKAGEGQRLTDSGTAVSVKTKDDSDYIAK